MGLAREVGREYGVEYWRVKDSQQAAPAEAWKAICDAGLGGLILPEEYGGGAGSVVDMSLAIEELAASGAGATVGQLFMNNPIFGGISVSRYGSSELKEEVLKPLAVGNLWACMALTEPNAGANTLCITTAAHRDTGGWSLSGQKMWITGVTLAQKISSSPARNRSRRSNGGPTASRCS